MKATDLEQYKIVMTGLTEMLARKAWQQMKRDLNKRIKSGVIDPEKAKKLKKAIRIADKIIKSADQIIKTK